MFTRMKEEIDAGGWPDHPKGPRLKPVSKKKLKKVRARAANKITRKQKYCG